jgi:uncharacterized membrane protein
MANDTPAPDSQNPASVVKAKTDSPPATTSPATPPSPQITIPAELLTQLSGLVHAQVMEVTSRTSSTRFSGPIPPPEVLAGYEQVLAGSADRIITMAEKQASHRQSMESVVIKGDSRRSDRGLNLAFVLCMTTTLLAFVAALMGHEWFGGAIITGSLGSIAALFVYGHRMRKAEREEKAKEVAMPTPPSPPPTAPATAIAKTPNS